MNLVSKKLFFLPKKCYSQLPKIKFTGGNIKGQSPHSIQHSKTIETKKQQEQQHPLIDNLKSIELSLNYRMPVSNEEKEIINNGGPTKSANWNKMKFLKKI